MYTYSCPSCKEDQTLKQKENSISSSIRVPMCGERTMVGTRSSLEGVLGPALPLTCHVGKKSVGRCLLLKSTPYGHPSSGFSDDPRQPA